MITRSTFSILLVAVLVGATRCSAQTSSSSWSSLGSSKSEAASDASSSQIPTPVPTPAPVPPTPVSVQGSSSTDSGGASSSAEFSSSFSAEPPTAPPATTNVETPEPTENVTNATNITHAPPFNYNASVFPEIRNDTNSTLYGVLAGIGLLGVFVAISFACGKTQAAKKEEAELRKYSAPGSLHEFQETEKKVNYERMSRNASMGIGSPASTRLLGKPSSMGGHSRGNTGGSPSGSSVVFHPTTFEARNDSFDRGHGRTASSGGGGGDGASILRTPRGRGGGWGDDEEMGPLPPPGAPPRSSMLAGGNDGGGSQAPVAGGGRHKQNMSTSVFDFPVIGKNKKPYDMTQHQGKAMIVMNTASKCGYTQSGYTTATELYNKYKEQGFTVLGFPCNQFGAQEPGDAEEVEQFACQRFKAEFPILQKVEVNGDNASPFWGYLKKKPGILGTEGIKWNFTMFLIDRNGKPVERFSPGTSTKDIEKKLIPLLVATGPASSTKTAPTTTEVPPAAAATTPIRTAADIGSGVGGDQEPASPDRSHQLRPPRSGTEKQEIPLDRSSVMPLEQLAKAVPDWKAPVGPVCSNFQTERTLLARRMMRLTSKSSWELRVLLLTSDGYLLICDDETSVRRSLSATMIVKGTLITHWAGTALQLEVKDQHQLIVAPHRDATEDQTIDHVLAILRHFNPSMVVDSTVSEDEGSLKSIFNKENELKKQSSSGSIQRGVEPKAPSPEQRRRAKSELKPGHKLSSVLAGEDDLEEEGFEDSEKTTASKKTTNELVSQSWAAVCGAFTLEQIGKLFYDDLFEKAPALRSTLFDKTDMAMQPVVLIKTIDAAVKLLDKPDELVPVLIQLGERHAGYGSEEAHYVVVGEVFVGVLAAALGNFSFTEEVKAAWVEVYTLIQTKMLEGQNSEKGKEIAASHRIVSRNVVQSQPAAGSVDTSNLPPKQDAAKSYHEPNATTPEPIEQPKTKLVDPGQSQQEPERQSRAIPGLNLAPAKEIQAQDQQEPTSAVSSPAIHREVGSPRNPDTQAPPSTPPRQTNWATNSSRGLHLLGGVPDPEPTPRGRPYKTFRFKYGKEIFAIYALEDFVRILQRKCLQAGEPVPERRIVCLYCPTDAADEGDLSVPQGMTLPSNLDDIVMVSSSVQCFIETALEAESLGLIRRSSVALRSGDMMWVDGRADRFLSSFQGGTSPATLADTLLDEEQEAFEKME